MKRKGKGEKKRKKSANVPPSKTKKQNQSINQTNKQKKQASPHLQSGLAWQIENLGQNTGDLPPRTIADYSILHKKKKKMGGNFSEVQMRTELQ